MNRNRDHSSPGLLKDSNLHIIFGVTLVAVLGVASITPAFPRVISVFNISPQQVGLLITFFTLPGVVLTPVLGVIADRFGRKKILVPSMILFGIAGGACFLVRDFTLLVGLRLLQGIGGAALGSLNVTIIGDLYSGPRRAEAMGYNASVLSIGTAAYPVIGGALATVGWYYPFLLPLFAIPLGIAVLRVLKNPEPKNSLQLREYLTRAWESITKRQVIGLYGLSILTFILLYGSYLTYFPLLIDGRFGGSAFVIGLVMSSTSIATIATSSQLGRLSRRFSKRGLLLTAFSLYFVAFILVPFVPTLWLLLIPTFLFGLGQGLNVPVIQTLLADLAPMEQRAAVMSLNGMVLRMGQTTGPLIMGVAYSFWGIDGAFLGGAFAALTLPAVVFLADIGRS